MTAPGQPEAGGTAADALHDAHVQEWKRLQPPERLLRLPAVMAMTGRGRTATLDDVKAGRFPAPVRIGRATCWAESEVQAWIRERIQASRGGVR